MTHYNLNGRTVVLTGSTGGLGTALATALRQRGANLALLDLDEQGVRDQAAALGPETVARVTARRGYLLAISSMAAFVHSPLQGAYCASKAGVWALCDSTRLELRNLGVGVGSAHPTFFRTPMMDAVQTDPAGTRLWGGNTIPDAISEHFQQMIEDGPARR
ncbi:SDR family NAD(P)-dependent oxidoreductase [Nocardia sp. NPDC058176]|uniref:SDR family NAD(P)-dependent oxidoreductase n=1 Tax=Nocardia sp. NPDC058176 TaxID=3346368 RepID=UPI0036D97D0C